MRKIFLILIVLIFCLIVVCGADSKQLVYKGHLSEVATYYLPFPGGKKTIYHIMPKEGKAFLWIDNKKSEEIDRGQSPIFVISTNGQRIAYTAYKDGNKYLFIDNKISAQIDTLIGFSFTLDATQYSYQAQKDGKTFIVINGKKIEGVEYPIFSPDGRRLAYKTKIKEKDQYGYTEAVIIDGKRGKEYTFVRSDPVFSPDSSKVAYVAEEKGKQFIVMDDKEGEKFDEVFTPYFSKEHLNYFAKEGQGLYLITEE